MNRKKANMDLHAKFSSMSRHSHAFAATNPAQAHDDRRARQNIETVPAQGQQLPLLNEHLGMIPFALERSLLEETGGGLRFSGNKISEYSAFRHRFLLRRRQLRETRPDLFLKWIESTLEGQAKRYIRNAFLVLDEGKACDVVWETLEEVYGNKEVIKEDALGLIKRPVKSVGDDRKTLLEFRADMRNTEAILSFLGKSGPLDKPQQLGILFSALTEKLRAKLDTSLPPGMWTYRTFIEFLSKEIVYLDSLQTMKIGKERCSSHVSRWSTDFHRPPHRLSHLDSNPSTRRERQPKTLKVCYLHSGNRTHFVDECQDFLDMPTAECWQVAKKNNLCFNCLSSARYTKQCLTK